MKLRFSQLIYKRCLPFLFLLVLASCKKTSLDPPTISVSINESFTAESSNSVQIENMTEDHVYLSGSIKVDTGQLEILVYTPDGFPIVDTYYAAGKSLPIYVEFGTMYGVWTLKYKSVKGTGSINLSLVH